MQFPVALRVFLSNRSFTFAPVLVCGEKKPINKERIKEYGVPYRNQTLPFCRGGLLKFYTKEKQGKAGQRRSAI